MPRLAVAQRDAQEAVGRLGGLLEGALRAIRTVKTSSAEDHETTRVLTEARESARQSIRAVRIEAAAWTVTGAGMYLAILLVLVLGAWRTNTGALPVIDRLADGHQGRHGVQRRDRHLDAGTAQVFHSWLVARATSCCAVASSRAPRARCRTIPSSVAISSRPASVGSSPARISSVR